MLSIGSWDLVDIGLGRSFSEERRSRRSGDVPWYRVLNAPLSECANGSYRHVLALLVAPVYSDTRGK